MSRRDRRAQAKILRPMHRALDRMGDACGLGAYQEWAAARGYLGADGPMRAAMELEPDGGWDGAHDDVEDAAEARVLAQLRTTSIRLTEAERESLIVVAKASARQAFGLLANAAVGACAAALAIAQAREKAQADRAGPSAAPGDERHEAEEAERGEGPQEEPPETA